MATRAKGNVQNTSPFNELLPLRRRPKQIHKVVLYTLLVLWLAMISFLLPAVMVTERGDQLREQVKIRAGTTLRKVAEGAAKRTAREALKHVPSREVPLPH